MQGLRLEQLTLGGLLAARTSLETDPNLFLSHTHLPYSGDGPGCDVQRPQPHPSSHWNGQDHRTDSGISALTLGRGGLAED